ncbi:MAG: RNA methyltransferase [Anaerolineae bacterium]|nr:RNA methyltransferase [Anaerolineae bacterium]
MADTPLITSRQNRRIVEVRKLAERKNRQRSGRFLVEGVKLLAMGLQAGASPIEAFYCPKQAGPAATRIARDLQAAGAELLEVTPEVMDALAERDAAEGIVATFALFERSPEELRLSGSELVLVVDRLQDPGNLGTLIRIADAVGAAAVALVEPCVDPFDPKTVRGSMGSIFHVPLVRSVDGPALLAGLRAGGLRVVGTDAQIGVDWGAGLWQRGVALILGNEARGISPDLRPLVDAWARLPIAGRAESLNVAVAGGVLMYTWLRERERHT